MGYSDCKIIKAGILKSTAKGLRYVIPFLNKHPEVVILACAAGIDTFLEQSERLSQLDVIFVEEPDPVSITQEFFLAPLRRKFPESAIIYFSKQLEVAHIISTIQSGAAGYIPLSTKPKFLHQEFDAFIREGGLMIPPVQMLQILVSYFPFSYDDYCNYNLTSAEICIIENITRGHTPEIIAASSQKDIYVIRKHLKHIFNKIDLKSCVLLTNELK